MTTYFQYNERRTRKPPQKTEHGTEIVDIPDVMVTEGDDWGLPWTENRHGWHCTCILCRIDRGEVE